MVEVMAKNPKKKKANRQQASAIGAGGRADAPATVQSELEASILQLRGRRSMVLARQLKPESGVTPQRRETLVAAAHEAYVREMLDGGHTGSALDHARSFAVREPGLCRYWALSLQVRLGLVDNLETLSGDAAWRERLRLELVDPRDLVDCPVADLSTDARAVRDAWNAVDSGDLQTARALIAGIGRRSLLVDWRLFVQASVAAREGNAEEMEASVARIMAGSPAAHLGKMLRACLHQDREALAGTELASQLALPPTELVDQARELSAALQKSRGTSAPLNKSLRAFLGTLLRARRPAAAHLVLASACKGRLDTALLDAAYGAGIPYAHIHLCGVMTNLPKDEWEDEYDKLLREPVWSPQERALLRLEQARDIRQDLESEADAFDWYGYDDEDEDEDLAHIQAWCREAAGCWPTLREVYALWSWAERSRSTHHAETAETRAFPADPQAWDRLARRLAKLAKFKECEKALASLASLPGTNEACNRLRSHLAFQKVCDAFNRELPFATLESLAGACTEVEPMERIGIAARLWLQAKGNSQRRRFGAELAELGRPWLAAVHCLQLSAGAMTVSKLPSSLKQALQADSAAVVNDFLLLAAYPERSSINWQDNTLLKPLVEALANPGVPPQAVLDALYHLMLGSWHDAGMGMRTDFCSEVVGITARLLDSGEHPTPVAVGALAYRVLLYDAAEYDRDASQDSIAVRLLRAARQLASDEQSRRIVREIGDKTGLIKRSSAVTQDAGEALSVWRHQCTIRSNQDFWDHFCEGRKPVSLGHNQFDGNLASQMERVARALGIPMDASDEDWDDEEDEFEPPVSRTPWPAIRGNTSSRNSIDLNKCHPTSEMEFEVLIDKISQINGTKGEALLHRKIEESQLSDKAKARLFERLARTIEEGESLF
jgi:hypothetical protein